MLSHYHRQFLERLNAAAIPYLVVGGQARRQCRGEPGHDLDLWLGYSVATHPVILAVMLEWAREHPVHVQPDFQEALALGLRDGIQLKFPMWDGVRYMAAGQSLPVSIGDGIDVLIGGRAEPSFEACIARAVTVDCDGMQVTCLCPEDDALLPSLDRVTVKVSAAEVDHGN